MADAPDSLEKASPDEGTLIAGSFESLAAHKVQLDIDDAPFLLPDELPLDDIAPLDDPLAPLAASKKPINVKKISIYVVALFGLAAIVFLLYTWITAPPAAPPVEPLTVVVPNHDPLPNLPAEYSTTLAPFWIQIHDASGQARFLVCTFTLGTLKPEIHKEVGENLTTLRDAIYYYLINKDYTFLTNPGNSATIKNDLLAAVNNYLVQGELEQIYFDNYLVH